MSGAWETEKKLAKPDKTATYACPRCGGEDVEGTAWVHLNSGEEMNGDPPDDDIWCPDCENHSGHVCLYDKTDPARECYFHCGNPVPLRAPTEDKKQTEVQS